MLMSITVQSDLYSGEQMEPRPRPISKKAKLTQRYNNYMTSPAWYEKRAQRIFMDRGRCQFSTESGICGCRHSARNPLQVHHKTYVRFGNENMDDLVTLCKFHHKQTHKQQKVKHHG